MGSQLDHAHQSTRRGELQVPGDRRRQQRLWKKKNRASICCALAFHPHSTLNTDNDMVEIIQESMRDFLS